MLYQAESPDEGALVSAAKDMGYELIGRNSNAITTAVNGTQLQTQVLAVNKFDSDRCVFVYVTPSCQRTYTPASAAACRCYTCTVMNIAAFDMPNDAAFKQQLSRLSS